MCCNCSNDLTFSHPQRIISQIAPGIKDNRVGIKYDNHGQRVAGDIFSGRIANIFCIVSTDIYSTISGRCLVQIRVAASSSPYIQQMLPV